VGIVVNQCADFGLLQFPLQLDIGLALRPGPGRHGILLHPGGVTRPDDHLPGVFGEHLVGQRDDLLW